MNHAPAAADPALLDDLCSRLRSTRRVAVPPAEGWSRGVDADYLTELLAYWAHDYDWPTHENELSSLPWAHAGGLRCLHARAGADAPTVVLLHGWPDSFLRYTRALPLLADLNVVVPCLPGYPYAAPGPGAAPQAMAALVAAAMAEFGYRRYVVSGGDIGSMVAEVLATAHRDQVAALHLTNVPLGYGAGLDPAELTDEEQRYLGNRQAWQQTEGAYVHLQATKPNTLAVGLGDSPAGLAAWIVEKLRSWSDCGGDLETVWSRDEMLTWLTLYWLTESIGTSFAPYTLPRAPIPTRVPVPAFFQMFAHDIALAPRHFAERFFDVHGWDEQPRGGHFGPWEQPEAFATNLRHAVTHSR